MKKIKVLCGMVSALNVVAMGNDNVAYYSVEAGN